MKVVLNISTCLVSVIYTIMTTLKALPLINKGDYIQVISMFVTMFGIQILYGVILIATRDKNEYKKQSEEQCQEVQEANVALERSTLVLMRAIVITSAVIFGIIFLVLKTDPIILFLLMLLSLLTFMTLYKRTEQIEKLVRKEGTDEQEINNVSEPTNDSNTNSVDNDII